MKEFYIEEKGIYYRTNEFIAGRKTLVFVHGLSGSSSAWAPYEALYQDTFNVLTYDLRGHGKSMRPKGFAEYAIPRFTDDLLFLLDTLGIEKCVLISHSFGTLIAAQFVLEHEERVEKAVFLSPNFAVGGYWLPPFISLGVILTKLLTSVLPKQPRMSHVDYAQYIGSGDWDIKRSYADVMNTGLLSYLYSTRQTVGLSYMKRLHTITIPVLLMHGKRDTIFRYSNSLRIAKAIPQAKLILLERANHILVLNYFKEVSAALSDFIHG